MTALQHFFDAERLRRGWSMQEIAKRTQMSRSKAYAIVNGDDNVEFETFENIASAFSMSPAELAVAIGKGAASDDPKRVPIHAALRQVPDEQLATVEMMIRGLAAPVQPLHKGPTSRRRSAPTITSETPSRKHDGSTANGGETGAQGGVSTVYRHPARRWPNLLNTVKAAFVPLLPSTTGLTVEMAR